MFADGYEVCPNRTRHESLCADQAFSMQAGTRRVPKAQPTHRSTSMRSIQPHLLPGSAQRAAKSRTPRHVLIMRALVLLLIVLLLIFVGLMHATSGYHVGGPVLGGILLIGLGAANCAR
jgi:hypothetical protein